MVTLGMPAMPLGADLDWVGIPFGRIPQPMTILLHEEQLNAVAGGEARVIIEGRVVVMESRMAGVLPLQEGARVASHGARLELLGADADDSEVLTRLRASTVGRTNRRHWDPDGSWFHHSSYDARILYALVNDDRGEAALLGPRRGQGTIIGTVLPGLSAWSTVWDLGLGRQLGTEPAGPPGPDWLAGADLAVLEWVPVGSYPIQVRVGVEGQTVGP